VIWVLGRQWLQFVPLNAIRRIDAGQPSGHSLNDSIAALRFVSTYEEVREFVRINSWLVGQSYQISLESDSFGFQAFGFLSQERKHWFLGLSSSREPNP